MGSKNTDLFHSGVAAALLNAEDSFESLWSNDDLCEMMLHQLKVQCAGEFREVPELATILSEDRAGSSAAHSMTFEDLLVGKTPLSLLRALKEYAKICLNSSELLPHPIARVFYIEAILHALEVHGERISRLTDANLLAEGRRCLTLFWLPESVKQRIRSRLQYLASI